MTPQQTARAMIEAGDVEAVARLVEAATFGRLAFDDLWERFVDGGYEVEIGDFVTEYAVKAGLVEKTNFDSEQHTDETGACEAGDDFWQITPAGMHLLRAATLPAAKEG